MTRETASLPLSPAHEVKREWPGVTRLPAEQAAANISPAYWIGAIAISLLLWSILFRH